MFDAVRATTKETDRLFAKSSYTWSTYAISTDGTGRLPSDSVNLLGMLGHVPAYVDFRKEPVPSRVKLEPMEYDDIRELWVPGSSAWRTTNGQCDLQEKIISQRLLLGISSPATLSFTAADDRFKNWPGVENIDQPVRGNCIAILTLAWCYILSAKWVEMQPPSHLNRDPEPAGLERPAYLDDTARFGVGDTAARSDFVHVDLGGISDDAARWWAAILAPETGWEAAIVCSGKKYLSPWSIRIRARESFVLSRTEATSQERVPKSFRNAQQIPPSYTMALQYLSEFCSHHGVSGQCFAALATALLIPFQGRLRQLHLPRPNIEPTFGVPPSSTSFDDNLQQQAQLLPFYMSISCNTQGIRPLLHGPFYEPSLSCNLVSAWLDGALETIDSIIQLRDYSKLATVMCRRQPRIAPLWLGAIILGIENQFLQPVRAGMFAIDLNSAAWTNTSHSFTGPRHHIPSSSHGSEISRADECRLLYIAQPDHSRIPVCPWEPFGYTDLQDVDIEVREHAHCAGKHCLQYESWAWDLRDGSKSAPDRGFIPNDGLIDTNETACDLLVNPHVQHRSSASESQAEIATRSIFSWLRLNGYPLREREIWTHPWLNIDDSDDEESDDPAESTDADSERRSTIEKWVSNAAGK